MSLTTTYPLSDAIGSIFCKVLLSDLDLIGEISIITQRSAYFW